MSCRPPRPGAGCGARSQPQQGNRCASRVTASRLLACLALSIVASFAAAQGSAQPEPASGWQASKQHFARRQLAVTANPHASAAALAVLRAGGSAVDAAIAAQMVLNVVEPQSSGLGGGFLLAYRAGRGAIDAYDGRETAPAGASPALFLDEQGQPRPFREMVASGRSVGVPGLLAMLELAHREHGRLPWRRLFAPAIALADEGFPVSPRLHQLLQADPELRTDPAARALFYQPDGQALAVGALLRNPALAATLRTVAEEGPAVFYRGALARAMVAAVAAHPRPGTLGEADLAAYRPVKRSALCGPYRAYTVCGMPPPSSGATTVLATLGILGRYDLAQLRPGSAFATHLFAEAGRLAYADRDRYLADPAFAPVPVAGLLAPDYLASRAAAIRADASMVKAAPGEPRRGAGRGEGAGALEQPATTHLSIVDRWGNAVAFTSSIEDVFGSRILVAGFLLNNQLTDFSFRPEGANAPAPGKRPRSSMAPTLVFDQAGKLVAVLGSPGGSRIPNYVSQTLVGLLDWGMTPAEAVAQPHAGSRNGPTELEAGTATETTRTFLEALGHPVKVEDMTSGLHLIQRVPGGWLGAADPRREGAAAGN
jgi:gamma-glutamyltranspeptidase/glutathione hydrolase